MRLKTKNQIKHKNKINKPQQLKNQLMQYIIKFCFHLNTFLNKLSVLKLRFVITFCAHKKKICLRFHSALGYQIIWFLLSWKLTKLILSIQLKFQLYLSNLLKATKQNKHIVLLHLPMSFACVMSELNSPHVKRNIFPLKNIFQK